VRYRLEDAQRELSRTTDATQRARIETDIALLQSQIAEQQRALENPRSVAQQIEANIAAGLERERQPKRIGVTPTKSKFINPPPGIAPSYFQGRHLATKLIGDFLKDLELNAQNYYRAWNDKGLAYSGLALCESSEHIPAAIEAYRPARALCKDVGIVNRVLRLFDALAVADEKGILAEVRRAAAGEA
jgi:hypothetical protein